MNCIYRYKRRHGSSRRLHFTGSQRGLVLWIRFPFRKRKKQHNIYSATLRLRVVTDNHKHYTQMITLTQVSGSLILLLLFLFTFPRTTDNSIYSLVTILRVAMNVGNNAFHMAAGRSYRTQTPTYFRILFTCSVIAQWLRCCATNRKAAGSIPAVSGFFIDIKSFRSHYGPGGRLSL